MILAQRIVAVLLEDTGWKIKVYRTPSTKAGKNYELWTAVASRRGQRIRVMRTTEEKARAALLAALESDYQI